MAAVVASDGHRWVLVHDLQTFSFWLQKDY